MSTLCVTTLCEHSIWEHSICEHSMCDHSMWEHSICEHSMCEHSMCDHSMWDHSMCPLYGGTLCETTLCVHALWEHSICEHSMCDHSMWDHSMCPLFVGALYVRPLYVSTLCGSTLYVSTLCVSTLCEHSMWALYVSTLWEHSMCDHSMLTLYVSTLCVTTLCEHSICEHSICEHCVCDHSMWALYVSALCVTTLCDHSMWEHSICEHCMCDHSMWTLYVSSLCEHSMCDHSMWALYVRPLYMSTPKSTKITRKNEHQFLGRMLQNTEKYENYQETSTSVLEPDVAAPKTSKKPEFYCKNLFKSIGEHRKVRELPRKMNIEEVEEPKKYENLQTKPVLDPFKSTAPHRKVRELPQKMNIEEVEEPETMKIYRQNPFTPVAATRKLWEFTHETNMQARNHENSDEICAQPVRHLDLATPAFYHYRKNPKCYHTVWGKMFGEMSKPGSESDSNFFVWKIRLWRMMIQILFSMESLVAKFVHCWCLWQKSSVLKENTHYVQTLAILFFLTQVDRMRTRCENGSMSVSNKLKKALLRVVVLPDIWCLMWELATSHRKQKLQGTSVNQPLEQCSPIKWLPHFRPILLV